MQYHTTRILLNSNCTYNHCITLTILINCSGSKVTVSWEKTHYLTWWIHTKTAKLQAPQTQHDEKLSSFIIPLSHYGRNAPWIHNVGHFFQISKVPSGFCKFRPAFLLDSVTFVAIAKCSQMQLRVGNLFHFPKNSWVHWEPNTTKIRVYEYDTMKQERKTILVRTFVQIYCDMVENERNARRLY